jgi:hypothetical protein
MRRRDKPLDINKRLQIVRAIEDLVLDEDIGGPSERSVSFDGGDIFKAVIIRVHKLYIIHNIVISSQV